MWLKKVSLTRCLSGSFQATVFIDMLINTYSSKYCRSHVYPWCKCCQPCAVNEYYYKKKYESIVEPTRVRLDMSTGYQNQNT